MKASLYLGAISSLALIGCTTYPQNYTYSPSVSVGGDNQGGITLPSPYANKPQPVQQPPSTPQYITYNDNSSYEESDVYDTPVYFHGRNTHYQDEYGNWR